MNGQARATGEQPGALHCTLCSDPLPQNSRGPKPTFCKKCRKDEQNRRARERRATQGVL